MKAATYIGIGLGLVVIGFTLDKAGVQNWPSNVSKWWNGPPNGASELCLSLDEALKDESAWKLVCSKKVKWRNEYRLKIHETTDITNGRIVFTGVNSDNNIYHDGVAVIPATLETDAADESSKVSIKDTLNASESVYLFKKARAIYKKLRYEAALAELRGTTDG